MGDIMLAASAFLGLLVMGAAMGSLFASVVDGGDDADLDDAGHGDERDTDIPEVVLDADAAPAEMPGLALEEPALDGRRDGTVSDPLVEAPHAAPQNAPGGTATSAPNNTASLRLDDFPAASLSELLFGVSAAGGQHPEPGGVDHAAGPAEEETAGQDLIEVEAAIILGEGPAIPHVTDFDTETDRLVLDFNGEKNAAPVIDLDVTTRPGDAIVLANGLAITLVANAPGMTEAHVLVNMVSPGDGPGTASPDESMQEGSFSLAPQAAAHYPP